MRVLLVLRRLWVSPLMRPGQVLVQLRPRRRRRVLLPSLGEALATRRLCVTAAVCVMRWRLQVIRNVSLRIYPLRACPPFASNCERVGRVFRRRVPLWRLALRWLLAVRQLQGICNKALLVRLLRWFPATSLCLDQRMLRLELWAVFLLQLWLVVLLPTPLESCLQQVLQLWRGAWTASKAERANNRHWKRTCGSYVRRLSTCVRSCTECRGGLWRVTLGQGSAMGHQDWRILVTPAS